MMNDRQNIVARPIIVWAAPARGITCEPISPAISSSE